MLKTLHIENIAVIERADVEFSAGLSVLTGETGAGKSIIIDSLNAVLGNRVSRELVRSGAERASVTASFESAQAERWCADNEIDADDGEIILQRRISTDGKSTGRVNGVPVTASQLRELGALLLDIHGQNDGRQLLDERRHLDYLDAFGECGEALAAYRETYDAYRALVRESERLSMDEAEKQRLEESLRYRIAELSKAEIRPGEEAELTERRDLLRNSEKLTEHISAALAALYDSDSSAVAQCGDAEYNVSRAGAWSADLAETEEIIRSARLALEDASERLREKQQLLDFSPEEYDRLEERLAQLRRLEKNIPQTKKGSLRFLRIPSAVSTSWNTRATGSRSWKRKRRRRMRLPKRRHARSPISGKLRQSGSRSASSASFVISACRRSALRCGFFPAKGKTPCPPPARMR